MKRSGAPRFAFASLAAAVLFVACGARTGLYEEPPAPIDATVDAPKEGSPPFIEGGALDVQVDCPTPAYCDPSDLGYVWKCGERIIQCSSLEQCEENEAGGDAAGASCVNPCLDSLGNNTSNGCEFYSVEMDTTDEAVGVCYAVFVVNQWKTGEPAKIEVTRGSTVLPIQQFARIPSGTGTGITYGPYDPTVGLPTNQIAILFLSRDPASSSDPNPTDPRVLANCPPGVQPAIAGDAALHGTGVGTAFHLKTNVPVVAYQMLPYGGGSARVTGSTLLVPTNAWDVNYLVADAYTAPPMVMEPRAGPTTVVIAASDDTHVTMKPTTSILAGPGIVSAPAGSSVVYDLNQGGYLQFTQPTELTGTAIQSDKPVAVIGGSTLIDLPLSSARADSAEQMLPPVRALGSEYVAVRYRSRSPAEESVPWRIVGAVDGTMLTYDPAPPPGAPAGIAARQLAEFDAPGPFVVRSQDAAHPFYLASYMTGGGDFDGTGDPEFVNVIPPAQFLPRYTFFTDPTYPETNLVVVRTTDPSTGQMPVVTLDCAGVLGGWTPVDTAGTFQMTRVDLSTGNFQGVGGCNNGVHVIGASSATASIGVTVWGWGNDLTWPTDNGTSDETNPLFTRWVSYGYPAGANFRPLNSAVLPAK
ncbi:MAG TPA: IgGFc-binding protein [Polyangiaceae bacterium]